MIRAAALLLLLALPALAQGPTEWNPKPAAGDLVLSGNLEVTDAQLGFKVAGRVSERLVDEGGRVTAGQLVARLDDAEQQDQLALRQAELAGAEALLAELEAGSRPQEIAAAEAALRSTEAERDRVRLDHARLKELRQREVIADRKTGKSSAENLRAE